MAERVNQFGAGAEKLFEISLEGLHAKFAWTKVSGETEFEQYEDAHRVFMTLEGRTQSTIAEVERLPAVRRPDQPGTLTIVPAGIRRRVLLQDIDFLIMSMRIPDEFLRLCAADDADADASGDTPGQLPLVQNMPNHWLLRAAHALKDACMSGAPRMQIETQAFAMVRHLARARTRVSESGGLDPLALARVLQLMQDRLAEDLTLKELAAEAGLGVSAFGRAFAKSLGMAPYRYFAAARIQRAKELLARGGRPLAEIAGEVGYADQAHFTAAFTRHTGLPPGKWRADSGRVSRFLPISRKTKLHEIA